MDEASDEEQQAWERAQAKRAMAGNYEEEKNDEVYIPAPSEYCQYIDGILLTQYLSTRNNSSPNSEWCNYATQESARGRGESAL